jgi:hypothetical protein
MARTSGSYVALVAAMACVATILVGCGGGGGGGGGGPSPSPGPTTPAPTPAPTPTYKAICEWSPDGVNNTDVKLEILSCDDKAKKMLQTSITTVKSPPIPLNGGSCDQMLKDFLANDCKPEGATNPVTVKNTPANAACQYTMGDALIQVDMKCDGKERDDTIITSVNATLDYTPTMGCDGSIKAWKSGQESAAGPKKDCKILSTENVVV